MKKKYWNTQKLCTLALLTAITVILSIYATFRVGNQIKIPLKFITVFLTGAVFGPMAGGLVGTAADIINALLVPVGPIMLQITAVEFIYGFTFGLFFWGASQDKSYYIRTVLCALLHFGVGLLVTSAILTDVGYFSSFQAAVAIRFPAAAVTLVLHIFAICAVKRLVFILKRSTFVVHADKKR